MALIESGVTACPLCSQVISEPDEIVTTWHFIDDENDPLWRFSDSAIHRSCFLAWAQREEFVTRFNTFFEKTVFNDGTYRRMKLDGSISVHRK